ncbi:MAG TPA: ATP-dependent helicase [Chitinophagaceae bacterium]|nr:ATP-dependent helicase [Chitinophagaceae bacterium]
MATKLRTTAGLLLDIRKPNNIQIKKLLIQENAKTFALKSIPLQQSNLKADFKYLPQGVFYYLQQLTQESIQLHLQTLHITDEQALLLAKQRYILKGLQQMRPFLHLMPLYYEFIDPLLITTSEVKPAAISTIVPRLHFEVVEPTIGKYRLMLGLQVGETIFPPNDFSIIGGLLKSRNEFFIPEQKDIDVLLRYPKGYFEVHANDVGFLIEHHLLPLQQHYQVQADILFEKIHIDVLPTTSIKLSELNDSFLMITPQFSYQQFELPENASDSFIVQEGTTQYIIHRNKPTEQQLWNIIKATHKSFAQQGSQGYCYLSFKEAEKNQWLVKFYRTMQSEGIEVSGFTQLQHFKYNPHTPNITLERLNSNNTIQITASVHFGTQAVALNTLQKAFQHKEQLLLLEDGTLGVLPDNWQQQYGWLFLLGNVQEDVISLHQGHFSLLEQLPLLANNNTSLHQIAWQQYLAQQHQPIHLPQGIQATLRPYQEAGFRWMCLLDSWNLGGCLADDMGLGKTLQTICFLQYLIHAYPQEQHLVVCPTSLLFNWEAELQKFAPEIRYSIYHGSNRNWQVSTNSEHHVILTTYGTVRTDVDTLQHKTWGYVIADESHSIKNKNALATKALYALQSRNRLLISGTPIQNNTDELYSQFQWAQPGLLGTHTFFTQHFSIPIDKFNDTNKAKQLKKILHPFLLRRTKQQVATDLPAKTESILWCRMHADQQAVYDEVKKRYQQKLTTQIQTDGVGKNTMYILEALTRLRQICNAPQLVPEYADGSFSSAKMEALLQEIQLHSQQHKVLVFSQFTGMLQRIAAMLTQYDIPYLYLDGSTAAHTRLDLVQQFQQTNEEKIFLISLKAGGVGLTLTAADYVYLVDPWWNPAAEQQAIDRTHRIGQQQNVFAYRMICKDSIEEKILQLQQRKQRVADELITEDAGFIKQLTADDIAFLFA